MSVKFLQCVLLDITSANESASKTTDLVDARMTVKGGCRKILDVQVGKDIPNIRLFAVKAPCKLKTSATLQYSKRKMLCTMLD